MNYTSLIADKTTSGSIKRWVNHDDLDSEQILEEAQALIFQGLRIREMRAGAVLSLVTGDSFIAVPSGFLDPIALQDTTNNIMLKLRTEADLISRRYIEDGTLQSGTPYNFAILGTNLIFECRYDANATLALFHYAKPALLGVSNLTNFLTDRFPHLLRTACMAQAFAFRNNDERQQIELAKLAAYIQKTNAESDMSYRGLEVINEAV